MPGSRSRTWKPGCARHDLNQPFPEELNRVLTGRLAVLHFAATEGERRNLLAEGVAPETIHVTGNSGIDAVLMVRDRLASGRLAPAEFGFVWQTSKKLIVVTAHRRESFGDGFAHICEALRRLASRPDIEIVFPVHRNPNVKAPVHRRFDGLSNVFLVEPLDYIPFVDLMRRADLLITDSGGIQEEGPSLGKPILVMREKTERPEAVAAGTVRLVGTDADRIVREASAYSTTKRPGSKCRASTIPMAMATPASASPLEPSRFSAAPDRRVTAIRRSL